MSSSKHNDLASITPATLSDVLSGKYQEQIAEYMIIDARYPYEFEGGHIQNAESGYLRDQLFEKLFNGANSTGKPLVLIFHCEFSSERGPKLMRELREKDRSINKHSYPSLCFPEIYLLEGGYKEFYMQFEKQCMPQSYLPMLHDNHRSDMKLFRKKSKTWEMETRKRVTKSKLSFWFVLFFFDILFLRFIFLFLLELDKFSFINFYLDFFVFLRSQFFPRQCNFFYPYFLFLWI